MSALLGYHGFRDWKNMLVEGENERDTILFGFELEATRDFSNIIDNQLSPEEVATKLHNEFGDLFVYERDGSIGEGVEVISQPMSMNWYLNNIEKFKRLLEMLESFNYVSTKGGKCGLHIHYSRSALGLNKSELELLRSNNITEVKVLKVDEFKREQTIENVITLMNLYKEQLTKISGRNQNSLSRWCRFESNNDQLLEIKKVSKNKAKGKDRNRYTVVNVTNAKTIEIRLNRGTLLWSAFHTRLLLMYHIVDIARNYKGIISFKKIVEWKTDEETRELMKNYIEYNSIEERRVLINDVKKKCTLSLENEFRVSNVDFIGKGKR